MTKVHIPYALLYILHVLLALKLTMIRLGASHIAIDECGVFKGCFRSPVDCQSVTSCDAVVTWQETPDGGSLIIELAGISPGYVAVGFSGNQRMSNTDVLACVDNNGATLKHFYNPVRHVNEPRTQVGVADVTASSADGVIQCRFKRVKSLDGNQEFADLREDTYVLLARGLQSDGFLTYHTLGYFISSTKQNFSVYRAADDLTTAFPPYHDGNSTQRTLLPTDFLNTEASPRLTAPSSNGASKQYISLTAVSFLTVPSVCNMLRIV
ncbi:DOMON domain-containing protein FRRS1L-like isoform X2 [Acanthaster planci]|nr:DOMON domain-containing protein FRRS1L-like isoform X2 [Acanthaster planci]